MKWGGTDGQVVETCVGGGTWTQKTAFSRRYNTEHCSEESAHLANRIFARTHAFGTDAEPYDYCWTHPLSCRMAREPSWCLVSFL